MKIFCLGKGTYIKGFQNIKKIFAAKGIEYVIGQSHEGVNDSYDLTISFGYNRIIPEKFLYIPRRGTVCFHSSDLPEGRGWAPLYYAIVQNKAIHTLSLFFANEHCDAGDLIAKIKCSIHPLETIQTLMEKDEILTEVLLDKFLISILTEEFKGTEQQKKGASYNQRRYPKDSIIDPNQSLMELLSKVRALSTGNPAFFNINDTKVSLQALISKKAIFDRQKFRYWVEDYRNIKGQDWQILKEKTVGMRI